jgi:hypothetical protein
MKKKIVFLLCLLIVGTSQSGEIFALNNSGNDFFRATDDDLVFIHHSCGSNWLSNSLHSALLAKTYIDERNDITYGTDLVPDSGRPDSLAPNPGDNTNMNHWILWFNDYLNSVSNHDCSSGFNRIVMFKSCYPISNVTGDGTEPGDPFSGEQTITNYKAVFRHPDGPGYTYSHGGYTYKPLFQIFSENPNILFVPVTAPPRHYAPSDATNDTEAHRARIFNNWLKTEALLAYNQMYPGLNNVAVFDWFDILSYPDTHPDHPNRLKAEYGGESGNSHPNSTANSYSTQVFATNPDNFIDQAFYTFQGTDLFIDIKANGSDGPLSVSQGNTITLTLSLDPGSNGGDDADWWVLVKTAFPPPNDWYYYDLPTRSWMSGQDVTYQKALFNLSQKNIQINSKLPPGTYDFFFGVDLDMNGLIDISQMHYDRVQVTINQ